MPNDADDFLRNSASGLAHGSQMGKIVDGVAAVGDAAIDAWDGVKRYARKTRKAVDDRVGKLAAKTLQRGDIELPVESKPKRKTIKRAVRRSSR